MERHSVWLVKSSTYESEANQESNRRSHLSIPIFIKVPENFHTDLNLLLCKGNLTSTRVSTL